MMGYVTGGICNPLSRKMRRIKLCLQGDIEMQRVFLLRSIFIEESGLGKRDNDGIATEPHAHTGTDRAAVGAV